MYVLVVPLDPFNHPSSLYTFVFSSESIASSNDFWKRKKHMQNCLS